MIELGCRNAPSLGRQGGKGGDQRGSSRDDNVSHSNGHTTYGNGIILDDFDHMQGGSTAPPYRAATLVVNNVSFDNGGRGLHVFHSRNVVLVGDVAYHDLKDRRSR